MSDANTTYRMKVTEQENHAGWSVYVYRPGTHMSANSFHGDNAPGARDSIIEQAMQWIAEDRETPLAPDQWIDVPA